MTSLECKMELVKNLFAMVKPKYQKIREVKVYGYGYGPFDEDDEYMMNYYDSLGDKQ